MNKRQGSDPKKNPRSKRHMKVALVTGAAVLGSFAVGTGASAEEALKNEGESRTLQQVPVQKQLTTPRQLKASKPQASRLRLKGTMADARRMAQTTRGTDPMKSKILQAAVDAAKIRPGFNENANFSLSFALITDKVAEQSR